MAISENQECPAPTSVCVCFVCACACTCVSRQVQLLQQIRRWPCGVLRFQLTAPQVQWESISKRICWHFNGEWTIASHVRKDCPRPAPQIRHYIFTLPSIRGHSHSSGTVNLAEMEVNTSKIVVRNRWKCDPAITHCRPTGQACMINTLCQNENRALMGILDPKVVNSRSNKCCCGHKWKVNNSALPLIWH